MRNKKRACKPTKVCSAETSALLARVIDYDTQAIARLDKALSNTATDAPLSETGKKVLLANELALTESNLEAASDLICILIKEHKAQFNANAWWALGAYAKMHLKASKEIRFLSDRLADGTHFPFEQACTFVKNLSHDFSFTHAIAKEVKRQAEGGIPQR